MGSLTITVDGHNIPARYLEEGQRAMWQDFCEDEARQSHNPFVGFYDRVRVLPANLQEVALREFMGSDEYRQVPRPAFLAATTSLRGAEALCQLVTGVQGLITESNIGDVYPQLIRFIYLEELVIEGANQLDQVNQLRAQVGKPPIVPKAKQAAAAQVSQPDRPSEEGLSPSGE